MWFSDHFEASEDHHVTIDDILQLFKHTTGHETKYSDVLTTLKKLHIEVQECLKTSREYWKIPFRCKTHRLLKVGLTDSDEIRTEYVTIMHARDSGELTSDVVRDYLCKIGKIADDQADKLTFKTLTLDDEVHLITEDTRSIYVIQKMRRQYVIIDE